MLVEAFLAGMTPPSTQPQTATSQGEGFQEAMDRASEPSGKTDTSTQTRTERSERAPAKPQRARRAAEARPGTKTDGTEKKVVGGEEKESSAGEVEKTEATKPPVSAKEQEKAVESAENELKSKLAEAMGITVDEVTNVLAALNMQPADLLNPDKLNEFMQVVFEASSPVELLSVPDIGKVFAEVKAILSEFEDLPEMVAAVPLETVEAPLETEQPVETVARDTAPIAEEQPAEVSRPQVRAQVRTEAVEETTTPAAEVTPVQTTEAAVEAVPEEFVQEVPEERVEQTEAPETAPAQTAAQPAQGGNAGAGTQNNGEGAQPEAQPEQQVTPVNIKETTQFTQSVTRTQQAARPVQPQEVMNQLLERMRADVRGGVSELRITLRPENLGDVTLKVLTENGTVTAQFVAENQRVKEIIEANFDQLKQTLQQQGIDVAALDVEVGQNQQDNRRMEEFLRAQQTTTRRVRDIINSIAEETDEVVELEDSNVNYIV